MRSHSQSPRNVGFERCTNFCLNREGYLNKFHRDLVWLPLQILVKSAKINFAEKSNESERIQICMSCELHVSSVEEK